MNLVTATPSLWGGRGVSVETGPSNNASASRATAGPWSDEDWQDYRQFMSFIRCRCHRSKFVTLRVFMIDAPSSYMANFSHSYPFYKRFTVPLVR